MVDSALQAVEGAAQSGRLVEALAAGDGVDRNDVAFASTFPYAAAPNAAAVNRGAETRPGGAGGSGGGRHARPG